jgi:hypothetical protein
MPKVYTSPDNPRLVEISQWQYNFRHIMQLGVFIGSLAFYRKHYFLRDLNKANFILFGAFSYPTAGFYADAFAPPSMNAAQLNNYQEEVYQKARP